jgi:hypothetical protein
MRIFNLYRTIDNLPLGNFTITAWIYDEYVAGTTWGTVMGCYAYNEGWHLRTYSNADGQRSLHFQAPHSGSSYTSWANFRSDYGSITSDNWHHVVSVWYAGTKTAKLYIDGIETSYQMADPGVGPYNSDSSNNKEIGRIPHVGGGHYFNGIIDDLRIYTRALSSEEIEQLYQYEPPNVVSLEIIGPEEVSENSYAVYHAFVEYDDNSTHNVTDLAQWSVEPNNIATIEANGLLTTGDIDKSQAITIYAQYTQDTNVVEAEKHVSIFALCSTVSTLDFDGNGDYANIGNTVTHNLPKGTFMAWINPENIARICGIRDFAYIVGAPFWQGELGFRVSGDGGGLATVQNTTSHPYLLIPPDTFFVGSWYHVALTWDGAYWRGYVDGEEKGNVASTLGTSASSSRNTLIGKGWDGCTWDGMIDEVSIWATALTAEQIEAQMYVPLEGDEPNLVAAWNFDEAEGQIAHDLTGGNDAFLGSDPCNIDAADPIWVMPGAPVMCTPIVEVALDIKPGGCPNPFNVKNRGVLPAAILGTEDVDVTMIDPTSIRLAEVEPLRSSIEDVAAPVTDGNECDCTTAGPDGFADLTLKFESQAIVEAIGEVNDGQIVPLPVTGVLTDETPIEGIDCVLVFGRFKPFNQADTNKDGVVDIADFAILADNWLKSSIIPD